MTAETEQEEKTKRDEFYRLGNKVVLTTSFNEALGFAERMKPLRVSSHEETRLKETIHHVINLAGSFQEAYRVAMFAKELHDEDRLDVINGHYGVMITGFKKAINLARWYGDTMQIYEIVNDMNAFQGKTGLLRDIFTAAAHQINMSTT